MSTKKQPSNPAAALAKLRWAKATDKDKQAAADAMTAGRQKISPAKRKSIAKKAAKARWAKAKKKSAKNSSA